MTNHISFPSAVDHSSMANLAVVSSPPWVLRADMIKRDVASSSQFEQEIRSLNKELVSLTLQLKTKEQSLAESAVKVEILEKKVESLQKQVRFSKTLILTCCHGRQPWMLTKKSCRTRVSRC